MPKRSSRTSALESAGTCSKTTLLPPRSLESNAAHLPGAPDIFRPEDAPYFLYTGDAYIKGRSLHGKSARFVSSVYDARHQPVVDHLGRLDLEPPVQIEVPKDLLARLDRLKSLL